MFFLYLCSIVSLFKNSICIFSIYVLKYLCFIISLLKRFFNDFFNDNKDLSYLILSYLIFIVYPCFIVYTICVFAIIYYVARETAPTYVAVETDMSRHASYSRPAILSPVNVYNRKYTSQNSRRITSTAPRRIPSTAHAGSHPRRTHDHFRYCYRLVHYILSVDTNGAPRPHRLCRPCIRASGPLDHGRSRAEESHLECSQRRTDIMQDRLNINGDRKLVGARGTRACASQHRNPRTWLGIVSERWLFPILRIRPRNKGELLGGASSKERDAGNFSEDIHKLRMTSAAEADR